MAVVQADDVIAQRAQQQHVVADAAARDQRRATDDSAGGVAEGVAAGVALEGRRDQVGALGEQVGEGERRAGAVPGREGLCVEGVPGVVVGGDWLGGEVVAEFGGGGSGHCWGGCVWSVLRRWYVRI